MPKKKEEEPPFVVLTGSQGLIGSHVAAQLLRDGHGVVGVDNEEKYGDIELPHEATDNWFFYSGEIGRSGLRLLLSWASGRLSWEKTESIIACAGLIDGRGFSRNLPHTVGRRNAGIDLETTGFISRIKEHSPSVNVVYLSNGEAGESLYRDLAEELGVSLAIIRPFSCTGIPGDYHVIPDLVRRAFILEKGDEFPIHGSGEQARFFTHAEDVARAVTLCREKGRETPGWNETFDISSSVATQIKDVAKIVWSKIHGEEPQLKNLPPYNKDVECSPSPDTTKARDMLGFVAEKSIEDIIGDCIDALKPQEEAEEAEEE